MSEEVRLTSDDVAVVSAENLLNDQVVNLDAFWDAGLDQEEAERVEKEMLPKPGTYHTIPPFTVLATQFEAGGGRAARVMFSAFGEAVHTTEGTKERLRIRFSSQPEKQKSFRTGEEEYDSSYKKYLSLRRAYKGAFGADPETIRQIKDYLETYPVGLRVSRFDGQEGPMAAIVNIFAVKE